MFKYTLDYIQRRNHMLFNLEEIRSQRRPVLNSRLRKIACDESISPSLESFSVKADEKFDVFLSYSSIDVEDALKLAEMINNFGFSVYIDCKSDPQLSRDNVSRRTAECLRNRLDHCECLIYAATIGSKVSQWMPWEAGYMDAKNGQVAILPVAQNILHSRTEIYRGQEYLSLYPYISKEKAEGSSNMVLWTNETEKCYCQFASWLKGRKPYIH